MGTPVSEVMSRINNVSTEIYNKNGKVNGNDKIATGMEVKATSKTETGNYEVVIPGDITGDGEKSDQDLLMISRYMVGFDNETNFVQGPYLMATDINQDGKNATDVDLLKLARDLIE